MNRTAKYFFIAAFFLTAALSYAEKISFSADSMTGTAGSKNSSTTLSGNAAVITETMQINADNIKLSGQDFRYITAEGSVKGTDTSSDMTYTCEKMTYDRETKIAVLEKDVNLDDKANEVTAQAQRIEYNQDTEIAVMQISVSLKQKDNNCTAAYAIYRKKDQLLEMDGNPQVIQGKDTFRAQTITLNMNTQEIELSGRVKGTVTTEAENTEKQNNFKESGGKQNTENDTDSKTDIEKDKDSGQQTEQKLQDTGSQTSGETNE